MLEKHSAVGFVYFIITYKSECKSMKKLWITALLSAMFISISIFVYAERREKEVKIEDLPQNVQEFISSHFGEEEISSARIVKYGYHKVMLSNGYEVLFDRQGRWLEMENKMNDALPASTISLLPQPAQEYMQQKYPNGVVYCIERNHQGYEIKMKEKHPLKIHFDTKGYFLNEVID